jgi:hypothetical protein
MGHLRPLNFRYHRTCPAPAVAFDFVRVPGSRHSVFPLPLDLDSGDDADNKVADELESVIAAVDPVALSEVGFWFEFLIRSGNRVVTGCVALSQTRAHGRAKAEADARGARGMGEANRAVA